MRLNISLHIRLRREASPSKVRAADRPDRSRPEHHLYRSIPGKASGSVNNKNRRLPIRKTCGFWHEDILARLDSRDNMICIRFGVFPSEFLVLPLPRGISAILPPLGGGFVQGMTACPAADCMLLSCGGAVDSGVGPACAVGSAAAADLRCRGAFTASWKLDGLVVDNNHHFLAARIEEREMCLASALSLASASQIGSVSPCPNALLLAGIR